MTGYSDEVWRLFRMPEYLGDLAEADPRVSTGEAGSLTSGCKVRLQLLVQSGYIADARFRAFGCPVTIACAAFTAGQLVGCSLEQARALTAAKVIDKLRLTGTQPSAALTVEDALLVALRNADSALLSDR